MNRWIFPLLLLFLTLSAEARRFKIVGYVSGKQSLSLDKTLATKFTHLNYTFVPVADGVIQSSAQDSLNLSTLVKLKQYNSELKILISVGAEEDSPVYATAISTAERREKLANSILQFMISHQLDGVELHWLQTSGGLYGNEFNHTDQANYVLLMEVLRKKFDAQTQLQKRNKQDAYLLTLCGNARRQYLFFSGLGKAHQYLDFINVHCYDYEYTIINKDGLMKDVRITVHNANLYTSTSDRAFKFSADHNISEYIDFQIPSRKLVMGITFYGKGWNNVYEEDYGVYQQAESMIGDHIPYTHIKSEYLSSEKFIRHWDKQAQASFLYNKETGTFISYESQKSIRKKTNYIRTRKMGGAACMAYGMDGGELLGKVNKGLRGPSIALFRKKEPQPRNTAVNKKQQRQRTKEYNASGRTGNK